MKNNIYDKKNCGQIKELIQKLKITCNQERLPMFVTVSVKNTKENTEYLSDMILAGNGCALTEDRISKLLLALNGFDIEPPQYIKNDIRELREYYERISSQSLLQDSSTDVVLAVDRLSDMNRIVAGGDDAVPPKDLVSKQVSDEFLND